MTSPVVLNIVLKYDGYKQHCTIPTILQCLGQVLQMGMEAGGGAQSTYEEGISIFDATTITHLHDPNRFLIDVAGHPYNYTLVARVRGTSSDGAPLLQNFSLSRSQPCHYRNKGNRKTSPLKEVPTNAVAGPLMVPVPQVT
jgi:hypothetical protein